MGRLKGICGGAGLSPTDLPAVNAARRSPGGGRNTVCLLLLVLAATGRAPAAGQSEPLASPSAETRPTDLAGPYTDGTFGFAIPYPAGAVIERERRTVRPKVLEIVRFVDAPRAWSLALWLEDVEGAISGEAIVERLSRELAADFPGATLSRPEQQRIAGREAFRLEAAFEVDQVGWLRQECIVRSDPGECFRLILLTPRSDVQTARAVFAGIVGGFQILRTEVVAQKRKEALARGQILLTQIGSDIARFRAGQPRQTYLRLIEQQQDLGYLEIREGPTRLDDQPGVGIRQETWLFQPTGEVSQTQQEMFLSSDLSHAQWEVRTRVLAPARPGEKEQVLLSVERGVREGDKLVVTYTRKPNDDELAEKVIEVDRSFAPPAWFVVLPRLIDLDRPATYAFGAYDSGRRGLIVRTIEVHGQVYVTIDDRRLAAYRLLDGEGLIPPFSQIDVDEQGNILKVEVGNFQMLATTPEWVRERYREKVETAMQAMNRHPLKVPRLPRARQHR